MKRCTSLQGSQLVLLALSRVTFQAPKHRQPVPLIPWHIQRSQEVRAEIIVAMNSSVTFPGTS